MLACCIGFAALVFGDVGGGGNATVRSPYKPGTRVTAEDVASVRGQCSRARTLASGLTLRSKHEPAYGEGIGLAYWKGGRLSAPVFQFSGLEEDGPEAKVDLADIDSFWIVRHEDNLIADDRSLIELLVFPTISPRELVDSRPTYSDLRDRFSKSLSLWLTVKSGVGELCLVALGERGRYELVAKFTDIEPDTKVELSYGRFRHGREMLPAIWWATEAVTRDGAYPHRIIFKR